ncbi:MAG: aspartate racemase [Bacteroides sp. SM23_62_1]|nr:MAG: aspartate racemase [Bacteroides sp. SM23_62_1]
MSKHIGIVACSSEGALLCYQSICREAVSLMGRHNHPEISMHNNSLAEYMNFVYEDNWEGVAGLMISSANKLKKCGASFLICPDNTIHEAFPYIREEVDLPWLHIADEVAKTAVMNGFKKILVLGTKYLMTGPVYTEILKKYNIQHTIPDDLCRKQIDRIIFDELVYGVINPESRNFLVKLIGNFMAKGCDAVVLGCTEIPLIVLPDHSPLPVLDSTRILARAALREAVG